MSEKARLMALDTLTYTWKRLESRGRSWGCCPEGSDLCLRVERYGAGWLAFVLSPKEPGAVDSWYILPAGYHPDLLSAELAASREALELDRLKRCLEG